MYTHVPPSWASLPPPSSPLQVIREHQAELPVLYSSFLLARCLYMAVCICYATLSIHPILSFPHSVHKFILFQLTSFCQLAQDPQCGSKNVTIVTEMMSIHKLLKKKKRRGCLSVHQNSLSTHPQQWPLGVPGMVPHSEINQSPGGKVITLDPINYRRASDLSSFSTTLTLDSSFLYLLNTLLSASFKRVRTLTCVLPITNTMMLPIQNITKWMENRLWDWT